MPAGNGTGRSVQEAPAHDNAASVRASSGTGASTSRPKVSCDFTLLAACTWELRQRWLPAKVDQVIQADEHTVCLRLRSGVHTISAPPSSSSDSDAKDDESEATGDEATYDAQEQQEPFIDPFTDTQHNTLPWPWMRSPPGSDRGALAEVADSNGVVSWWLWLCWDPQGSARVTIGPAPERGAAAEAFSFGAQMAAELKGLLLLDAELPKAWERVVRLSFGPRTTEEPTRHVYAEVQGRYSNVVLTAAQADRAEKFVGLPILAAGHQVGALQSSERQLQVLGHYTLPPASQGLAPTVSEALDSWRANISGAAALLEAAPASRRRAPAAATVALAIVRAYQGMGPALAAELCEAAGVDGQLLPREVEDAKWRSLFTQWRAWLRAVTLGRFQPAADPGSGRVSVLGGAPQPANSVHALVDRALRSSQDQSTFKQRSGRLQRAVLGGITRLTGKLANLQRQQAAEAEAEATRRRADLLTANLHRCRQGDASVQVEDWETGDKITIGLDRAVAPSETAAALYRAARKQERTGEAIEPIIKEASAQLEHLHEIDAQLHMLSPEEDGALDVLKGIQDELVAMGVMRASADAALAARSAARAAKSARRLQDAQKRRDFRRFTTPGGLQVLVGRNNMENDRLSHVVAAKSDLWFHARGFPGSHTVLRIPPGSVATDEDISFAADLAAFYSKARTEGKVKVVKASVASLKKIPGAAPGKVMVLREEVVMGQPDRAIPLTLATEPATETATEPAGGSDSSVEAVQ